MTSDSAPVDRFIARWQGQEGGQERANYALFLTELCDVLGVRRPEPAAANTEDNDYVFERAVKRQATDGTQGLGRIDLYKRNCFVLEAKQSRQAGGAKELAVQYLPGLEPPKRGVRDASRTWDVLMLNARRQAEGYARALPTDHGWPPFILVCDVGHVIETYADFSGQGKNYAQFPDRQSFRIYLEDLRRPEIRDRLARIWTEPMHLDPARETARVTRGIAERLASVSKALEEQKHDPEAVAMFLMRCLFTMFACSPGIELLPEHGFRDLLQRCEADPSRFVHLVGQLWEAMDTGAFAFALEAKVRRFNGEFFRTRTVLPLGREEIGELRRAASFDWKEVDPSIFGTLLEQALDKAERRRLGAHYTPRAYVERLVVATVIEPLREDWEQALSTAERQKSAGRAKEAVATVRAFHDTLCRTRILDPACGTGNFLYVSLELLKRLEGEVLEALASLGGQEALTGLAGHTVDPHQFLGLEINPRAAAIAELVLWIGYLQWHFRIKGGMPGEPILHAFHNIQGRFDAVLAADVSLARDAHGVPLTRRGRDGSVTEVYHHTNPHKPDWPAAEFIVGNPPFIGGKDIRARLGDEWTEALWAAHPDMNESADFVMYWWNHAAGLLARKGTVLRRFGLVTTNSITQVFQRRVMERHLLAKAPISLVMAVPDHPWTKATRDAAAVRIAMTVVEAGPREGVLREVVREAGLDTDAPVIEFREFRGVVNSDLTVGVNVSESLPLLANEGLSSRGMSLHGAGFIVTPDVAAHLGLGRRPGLEEHIRNYRNGRDLTARPRGVMVIDLFGLGIEDVRRNFPEVYQHVAATVKPERDLNNRETYRQNWWVFGEPRRELRPALDRLPRYTATVETAKYRVFQFLEASICPDNKLIAIGSDDACLLGILSSRSHTTWATRAGSWLGIGNDPVYVKTRCFDPFPFPAPDDLQKHRIRVVAENLDAHRKRVLAEHPHLTLTGLYNVLEKLRAGTAPSALAPDDRRIFDDGLVLILKEYHDELDAAVAVAYGWAADLSDNDILARLVALNQERVREEAAGHVRWLRPDYQIPRFGSSKEKLSLTGGAMNQAAEAAVSGPKPAFPTSELEQTAAVLSALASATAPLSATDLAVRFRQGRRILPQIEAVLAALVRVGGLVYSPDGGRGFLPRRAA
ncbi:class I SAM-dependent DNA methyltransferase [Rhodopila sp.]|uniref:class I SAM-dependent DNA methyltransferase n=1 Tax=Rhodopila sp. TaxID=2480087 RepID=UPI003D0B9AC9